jgi:phospho-N-acetylmuramoyl-pentapeptide-transferase
MFTALTTYTVAPAVVSMMKVLAGVLLSWAISMIFGTFFIHAMQKASSGQPYNPDGPQNHLAKAGTPTAGGVFFILGLTITVALLGRITEPYTFIPLVAIWGFFLIGLLDDVLKLRKKESVGLRTSRKLAMQILVSALILWLYSRGSGLASTVVTLPWNPEVSLDIGMWYPLTALVYLVYFTNAVNITDGLDGLAVGSAIPVLLLVGIIAALFGFGFHSQYIQDIISSGSMDLALVIGAALGSLLAFFWYNGLKAQIFMGDCGSHAIGALIAVSALLMKIELVVLVASGMFFLECISSLIQIISIRLFQKKIFLMAPIHHHFEKRGFEESKIVTRFHIGSMLCAVLAGLLFMVKYL